MTHQEYYRGKHAWSFNEEEHKFGAMLGTLLGAKYQRHAPHCSS